MAGKKFSEFNGVTAMGAATSFLVGYDTVADTNNRWDRTAIAGWVGPAISIDTIFTTSPTSIVPTGQDIALADTLTFSTNSTSGGLILTNSAGGYGNIAIYPNNSAGTYINNIAFVNGTLSDSFIQVRANSHVLTLGGISGNTPRSVTINPTAAPVFALTSAFHVLGYRGTGNLTYGVRITGGTSTNASTALLVEDKAGAETFSVRDDGLVSVAVEATIPKRKFAITSSTDGDADGDVVYFGTGTTVLGQLYYYKSTGAWTIADANVAASADAAGLLGVALGTTPGTHGMVIRGMVTLDHDPGAVGDILYISTTAGQITGTVPNTSGDTVRIVGYCLDASDGQIWFNPSSEYILLV